MRFDATPEIITQLLSTKRFQPSDAVTFRIYSEGGNAPAWWNPEKDSMTEFYINEKWTDTPNYSLAVLGFDKAKRVVYFHHGISF